MAKAKYPKQLRITFVRREHSVADKEGGFIVIPDEYRLGYAIEHKPGTATYKKQLASQMLWAYESYRMVDGIIQTRSQWSRDDARFTDVAEDLYPVVIDNVPMEGFRIQKMVSRYGMSNNKVWRILDPRGFELETPSGAMEDLITTGTIQDGLIVGSCIWRTPKILARI